MRARRSICILYYFDNFDMEASLGLEAAVGRVMLYVEHLRRIRSKLTGTYF